MSVEFEALVKELNFKSLISGDKQAWLKLEFNAENDEMGAELIKLHKANKTVKVRIKKNG